MMDIQYVWASSAFLGLLRGMNGLRPFGLYYNPKYCVTWVNKLNIATNWEEGVCDSWYPEVELS